MFRNTEREGGQKVLLTVIKYKNFYVPILYYIPNFSCKTLYNAKQKQQKLRTVSDFHCSVNK